MKKIESGFYKIWNDIHQYLNKGILALECHLNNIHQYSNKGVLALDTIPHKTIVVKTKKKFFCAINLNILAIITKCSQFGFQ